MKSPRLAHLHRLALHTTAALPLALAATLLSVPAAAHATEVVSTFSTGAEGWFVSGFPFFTPSNTPENTAAVTWLPAGGHPGGAINSADQGNVFWFSAPAAFLHDQSVFQGGQLRYDLHLPNVGGTDFNPAEEGDVALIGASLTLVAKNGATPGLADWQSLAVSLSTATAWHVGTMSGPLATDTDLTTVLGDLGGLAVRGEYFYGDDNASLDNVTLSTTPVPEPETCAVSGAVGLLAFGLYRRWRR